MEKIALLFIGLFSLAWLVVACTNTGTTGSGGTSTGGSSATATFTPIVTVAATVGGSGTLFTNANPTITHGQAVVFDSTLSGAHTVYLNGFSGMTVPGGGCGFASYTSFPVTVTFPTAGTDDFRCSIHSACGTSSCSGCTGMIVTITVN